MPPIVASNIRATVHWKSSCVYSGEELECVITFQNIADNTHPEKEHDGNAEGPKIDLRERRSPMAGSRRASTVQTRPDHARALSMTSARSSTIRGHRPTLSLNVVSAPQRPGLPTVATSPAVRGHGRSLSIVSMAKSAVDDRRTHAAAQPGSRGGRSHARSASLHLNPSTIATTDFQLHGQSARQRSPLSGPVMPSPSLDTAGDALSVPPTRERPRPRRADNSSSDARGTRRWGREGLNNDFQFPARPPPTSPSPVSERSELQRTTSADTHAGPNRVSSPHSTDSWTGNVNNLNPIKRVMSEASATNDSPRTSGELYSTSNRSNDTLVSDLLPAAQADGKFWSTPTHSRHPTQIHISQPSPAIKPETLMMGSMQAHGQFVLDGSLVNTAPFDEVKRKGVQSGGGVVGMERSKRSSGIFGSLSWGTLGESLGGLLGADEMSSLAQMKASAGSKTIPLLSTPQTLLFVDLTLAPGESRSYSYSIPLPTGLPPSHRGRAIKIDYHLLMTIQRPGVQALQRVQIPFRVLGSYNSRGESLGHDLMSPYILLKDTARSYSTSTDAARSGPTISQVGDVQGGDLEDFLRYTNRLIEHSHEQQGALLSPTSPSALPSPTATRQNSVVDHANSCIKDAVDLAILRSNQLVQRSPDRQQESQSSNRFNIARAGDPVAVLTLLRPAYRLGEAVIGWIDLVVPAKASVSRAHVPTFSVSVELETIERVDPSLALRSSHSITRVTRRMHAVAQGCTTFATQKSFSLPIPVNATPTFETTGVNLLWRLRVEFTTLRPPPTGVDDNEVSRVWDVLEKDERGTTFVAKERLLAESFELTVPIKVYGIPNIDGVSGKDETYIV